MSMRPPRNEQKKLIKKNWNFYIWHRRVVAAAATPFPDGAEWKKNVPTRWRERPQRWKNNITCRFTSFCFGGCEHEHACNKKKFYFFHAARSDLSWICCVRCFHHHTRTCARRNKQEFGRHAHRKKSNIYQNAQYTFGILFLGSSKKRALFQQSKNMPKPENFFKCPSSVWCVISIFSICRILYLLIIFIKILPLYMRVYMWWSSTYAAQPRRVMKYSSRDVFGSILF